MSNLFVQPKHTEHADSIVTEEIILGDDASAVTQSHGPLTPARILSWLPADATPAQQDSAIQAHIKPEPIHWSECPDTLHLPGHPIGKSCYEMTIPEGYEESFFDGNPYYHPEMAVGRQGVDGETVPYSASRDNVITMLLLCCFVLVLMAFTRARQFILGRLKDFAHFSHSENIKVKTQTTQELLFQIVLVGQTSVLFGLLYFFYVQMQGADVFTVGQHRVTGIFAMIVLAYIIIKAAVYAFTGFVFFDSKSNEAWMKSFLFLTAMEGVCVFPLVMLQVYFGLPVKATLICAGVIVIMFKILSLWCSYAIFFSRKNAYLQFFLYFCTLEIIPLATLLGILNIASGYLEVRL